MNLNQHSSYQPQVIEKKWQEVWERETIFSSQPSPGKEPYTIMIPPPNITSHLTMGHVLNNTLQDILIRWRRKKGFETLWLPGTDHAGIATQNIVERELSKQGFTRQQLGREEFIKRVWEWKEKYASLIIQELKALGCSCDWGKERFTLEPQMTEAVKEAFIRLYRRGLIYRGRYIINWCPRCTTALSDEEVEHQEVEGKLFYIRYPFHRRASEFITIATTRPETLLGDTAVAVNPEDERYKKVIGEEVVLPILSRLLRVIPDEYVKRDFGSGALKITPAHDPYDFEIGKRHNLEEIRVIDEQGRMTPEAGPYAGLTREECREKILDDLRKQGLLEKVEPYRYTRGHCSRCFTVIEPYLSTQWFVKMKPLAKPAIEAVENGKIKLYPERWRKIYLKWLKEIKDWCISRQLWWGHRIPIYYCQKCGEAEASQETPPKCPKCFSREFKQDEDVLDTWFSSWLWPFSTLGWPKQTEELRYYYPTNTLITAPDIIFFWVARMVMAGLEFMGEVPFREVYFHGIIRDEQGRKMSKSLGNSPEPKALISQFGADALRFGIIYITPHGRDTIFSLNRLESSRYFCNKLWNAAKFIYQATRDFPTQIEKKDLQFELVDRWIQSECRNVAEEYEKCLENFQFDEAAHNLYEFTWHRVCDWYLEMVKPRLYNPLTPQEKQTAQYGLRLILKYLLSLLHPFMPFITEEIWHWFNPTSLAKAPWPRFQDLPRDKSAEREMGFFMKVVTSIRTLRSEHNIPPQEKMPEVLISLSTKHTQLEKVITENVRYLKTLCKVEEVKTGVKLSPPEGSVVSVIENGEIFLPLPKASLQREREKIEKEYQKIKFEREALEKRLSEESFLTRAPQEVVNKVKEKYTLFKMKEAKLQANLAHLQKALEATRSGV